MEAKKTFSQIFLGEIWSLNLRCRQLIRKELHGASADVVLHDGAPNVGAVHGSCFTASEWQKNNLNHLEPLKFWPFLV